MFFNNASFSPQPAHIQKVTKPSKSSENISISYKRQRTAAISSFRQIISKGASETQQADELQCLPTSLSQTDHQRSSTADGSLAMMQDCHLSWDQMRKFRR